jgi:hydrogenase maturation protease
MKKTLVLGIGNTIRGDDGVGIETVRRLREWIGPPDVDIKETSESGFTLLSVITDYDGAIIVDSIRTKQGKVGEIYRFSKKDLSLLNPIQFSHNTGIPDVLAWAEKMGISLPKKIIFYAVEIGKCDTYSEGLTKNVERVIPDVIDLIKTEIALKEIL